MEIFPYKADIKCIERMNQSCRVMMIENDKSNFTTVGFI
jgi:hypothetical protein